jgi:hypothetical protein
MAQKKGKEKGNPLFGSNHNNSFGSKVIADSTDDVTSYENMIPPSKTNSIYHHSKNTYRRSYTSNRVLQPSSKVDDNDNNNKPHFSPTDKLVERRIKLEEFKILVNKYYSHQIANEILVSATFLSSRGNADFLDEKLMLLRDLDRAKFGYS